MSIVIHNTTAGPVYYGPFKNESEAAKWASKEINGLSWSIVPVKKP